VVPKRLRTEPNGRQYHRIFHDIRETRHYGTKSDTRTYSKRLHPLCTWEKVYRMPYMLFTQHTSSHCKVCKSCLCHQDQAYLIYLHWRCSLEIGSSVTHSFYSTRQATTCHFCDTAIKQPDPFISKRQGYARPCTSRASPPR
jgi:hypothetical protein